MGVALPDNGVSGWEKEELAERIGRCLGGIEGGMGTRPLDEEMTTAGE